MLFKENNCLIDCNVVAQEQEPIFNKQNIVKATILNCGLQICISHVKQFTYMMKSS